MRIVIFLALILLTFNCKLSGQNELTIELKIDHVSIDNMNFDFNPPLTATAKVERDKASDIIMLKKIHDEDFGVRFVYHNSLTNVSKPGENPTWEKKAILEIEFYKRKNGDSTWVWFLSADQIVDDKIGKSDFTYGSTTFNDYRTNREYRLSFDFRVK